MQYSFYTTKEKKTARIKTKTATKYSALLHYNTSIFQDQPLISPVSLHQSHESTTTQFQIQLETFVIQASRDSLLKFCSAMILEN